MIHHTHKIKKSHLIFRYSQFNITHITPHTQTIIEFLIQLNQNNDSISIFHTHKHTQLKLFAKKPHNIFIDNTPNNNHNNPLIAKKTNPFIWISMADLIPYGEIKQYHIPHKITIYNHNISPTQINILQQSHNHIITKTNNTTHTFTTCISPGVNSSWRNNHTTTTPHHKEIFYLSLYHGTNPQSTQKILQNNILQPSSGENHMLGTGVYLGTFWKVIRYSAYSIHNNQKLHNPGAIFRTYAFYTNMREAPWDTPCNAHTCTQRTTDNGGHDDPKILYYIDHNNSWNTLGYDAAHVPPTQITDTYWIVRNDEWIFPQKSVFIRDHAFPHTKSLTTRIKRFARTQKIQGGSHNNNSKSNKSIYHTHHNYEHPYTIIIPKNTQKNLPSPLFHKIQTKNTSSHNINTFGSDTIFKKNTPETPF